MVDKCMVDKCMVDKCIVDKCTVDKCRVDKCMVDKLMMDKCIVDKCMVYKCMLDKGPFAFIYAPYPNLLCWSTFWLDEGFPAGMCFDNLGAVPIGLTTLVILHMCIAVVHCCCAYIVERNSDNDENNQSPWWLQVTAKYTQTQLMKTQLPLVVYQCMFWRTLAKL